jgi:hypothetical protein
MKEITKFIAFILFNIPSFKRRPRSIYHGHHWDNGGKEPPTAPTHEVKFEVY